MQDWLAACAQARPDALALIAAGQTWTYAELDQQVTTLCARLAAAGVTSGQMVAVLMPNRPEYVWLIHALGRLGATLVALNARLTAAELGWQLDHTGCTLLICSPETKTLASQLATPARAVWRIDALPDAEGSHPGSEIALDGLQSVMFTSGTTGQPKGVMLTWDNHFWSATASAFRLGTLPHDRWLCILPLYHVGGMSIVFRCGLYGTAVVLQQGFNEEAINRALDEQAVTLVSLVPTMLQRLIAARGDTPWPDSLRLVLLGGAATPPALVAECQRRSIPLATTYGLSESCSQVATMLPEDAIGKPGCVGKPLLFTSVRIASEQGDTLPPGEYGEVLVSGPGVMAGYYNNLQASERTLRGGELHTGDIGYLDTDGDLWLVQRRSDLIVSGGENVYPAEVERVLAQHPAVAAACVVGIDSAEWGQQVAAAVVLHAGASLDETGLLAFSRQHLAGYKQPRRVRFVATLPQTASGKVQRGAVQALLSGEEG